MALETLIKAKVPVKVKIIQKQVDCTVLLRAIHILSFVNVFVGVPTSNGTVIIEMWGAGGSWC